MICGIYKIESLLTKRIYVGSSKNVNKRWYVHKSQLLKNIHNNKKLQNHYNKYGKDDLIYSIIELCEINDLITKEQYYIELINPYFNVLKNAHSLLGYKHSKEAIEKIKIKNTGRKMTKEQVTKGVISRIGQKTRKGIKFTQEQKDRLSKAKKKKVVYNDIIYDSIKDVSDITGVKYQTIYAMITGKFFNKLNIKFYNGN